MGDTTQGVPSTSKNTGDMFTSPLTVYAQEVSPHLEISAALGLRNDFTKLHLMVRLCSVVHHVDAELDMGHFC